MVATYSENLKVTKQGDGDNSGSWGTVANEQVFDLLDEAVAGHVSVSLASTSATFAISNGTSTDGRHALVTLTGSISTNNRTVTLPASVSKWYVFRNNTTATTGTVKVLTSGGSNQITLPEGETRIIYSDGTESYQVHDDAMLVGRQTIYIPASAMTSLTTNGAELVQVEHTAGRPETVGYAFDGSTSEGVQFTVEFPKSWDEGTVTFQPIWTSTATDTDGVTWTMAGVALSDGDATDTAYGTGIDVDDAAQSTAYDIYEAPESTAVTIAGTPAEGDETFFKITRNVADANDTMSEDAILLGVRLYFTTNAGNDS